MDICLSWLVTRSQSQRCHGLEMYYVYRGFWTVTCSRNHVAWNVGWTVIGRLQEFMNSLQTNFSPDSKVNFLLSSHHPLWRWLKFSGIKGGDCRTKNALQLWESPWDFSAVSLRKDFVRYCSIVMNW